MECITLDADIVRGMIPPRRASSRKGENGRILIVGGSYIYHGAPILSSMAALRCGADLVYAAVPGINAQATRAASCDIIVIPLADQKLTRGAVRKLLGQVPELDSAAIGMGLAVADISALRILVEELVKMDVRPCLDAGALLPEILPVIADTNAVLTPHAGEFRRLFGRDASGSTDKRAALACELAGTHGVTILLKGATDIITDGSTTYACTAGTPAMTVGGTGDVLCGIVASMLSRNRSSIESAAAAAFVNGSAGILAHDKFGLHMVASDILSLIPDVSRQFDRITK